MYMRSTLGFGLGGQSEHREGQLVGSRPESVLYKATSATYKVYVFSEEAAMNLCGYVEGFILGGHLSKCVG
jgi:hypothetical protein